MNDKLGMAGWTDLTIGNTETVRDFYQEVLGWKHQALSMGEYDDYMMMTADGDAAAGVCHPQGKNAALPPVWLVYFNVADLGASVDACVQHGGKLLSGPFGEGKGSYAVMQDPAGAVFAISQAR